MSEDHDTVRDAKQRRPVRFLPLAAAAAAKLAVTPAKPATEWSVMGVEA